MEEIPVLGAVVRVITFRDYQYDDGHSTADVHVPELGAAALQTRSTTRCRPIPIS